MVKRLFATMVAACAFVLAFGLPSVACAAPAVGEPLVVYDGAAKAWHGENLQEQDVIATAADVLPGDVIVQEFQLAARHVERGVTLSMRPDAPGATLDALGDATIEVRDDAGSLVAQGTLTELASAEGAPLALGAYTADSARGLRITMAVPRASATRRKTSRMRSSGSSPPKKMARAYRRGPTTSLRRQAITCSAPTVRLFSVYWACC